ncbi:MAG: deoxyribonuclease IV [Pirellulales bacterium]
MAILGAHMSIAGGYYKAVDAAAKVACNCVQLFTKNNNQWRAKPIAPAEAELFRTRMAELGISHPLSHDSYLINLASPDDELWKKSIDSFIVELQRAEQLGIPYVVTHPGAYTTSSEQLGIQRIVQALDESLGQTSDLSVGVLLETTAGQGSCLGCRFEQLAEMLTKAHNPDRMGVCVDTCHIFAAGYAVGTEKDYKATMRNLDKTVGVKLIKAFHLNDSAKPLGSRVDRHAHIGRGMMGTEPFRLLLADRRFRKVPMYMETPKGEEKGRNLDEINLETLRGLIVKYSN